MDQAEFDKFAAEYAALHAANIGASGESPEYFAEYKVIDVADQLARIPLAPKRILDFGAGIGSSTPYFRKHFPESSLTCLDVSEASLELGRKRFGGEVEFRAFDGHTIPFQDDTFDAAFAACVFHHIDELEHISLFKELRRTLREGGQFFLFEHNPLNPLTVRAVNTCPFDENAVLINHQKAKERLVAAGFRSVSCKFRIFFPRALRSLRRFEPYLTWCPLGAQYYIVAGK